MFLFFPFEGIPEKIESFKYYACTIQFYMHNFELINDIILSSREYDHYMDLVIELIQTNKIDSILEFTCEFDNHIISKFLDDLFHGAKISLFLIYQVIYEINTDEIVQINRKFLQETISDLILSDNVHIFPADEAIQILDHCRVYFDNTIDIK